MSPRSKETSGNQENATTTARVFYMMGVAGRNLGDALKGTLEGIGAGAELLMDSTDIIARRSWQTGRKARKAFLSIRGKDGEKPASGAKGADKQLAP